MGLDVKHLPLANGPKRLRQEAQRECMDDADGDGDRGFDSNSDSDFDPESGADPDSDSDTDTDPRTAPDTDTGSDGRVSIDDVVDYCHTQAGLLSGQVDTMAAEADDLLAEIDEQADEIRARLDRLPEDVEATERPPSTTGPANGDEIDLEEIEQLQDDLEEKQLLVEAKHTRMKAFQELAADYAELADDLSTDSDSGRDALRRVVEFEADNDAPTYFEEQDRTTLLETAVTGRNEGRDEDGDGA